MNNDLNLDTLLKPINQFLQCKTLQSWIDEAIKPENLPLLLVDHANCELKAAQIAMLLLRKYTSDSHSGEHLFTV